MNRLHFMGIGGVGMAGVAFLLKQAGYVVSGCDKYATDRTRWLEAHGIPVSTGHSPSHLDGVDELIVTPAVPKQAPELAAAHERGLVVRHRGEVLADLVNAAFGIAICGTHGKTTTSTFTTKLLRALGDDPSWCIGGETGAMPVAGAATNPNRPLVVEADESDGTLALYRAKILVVMNLDYDHPEHFPTPDSYLACYETAMAQSERVVKAWELDADEYPELPTLVHGAHNVVNARAAIEVARLLGHSPDEIRKVLPEALAELPDRRFQRVWPPAGASGVNASIEVVTDYAHHPRELACAVQMAAALKPKRLRVLFQPHRYTRTQALCRQFPAAFEAADEVVLIPVYAAFEEPIPGGDIADLYNAFRDDDRARHPDAPCRVHLARSAHEAWRHIALTCQPGDLVLLAGAGDIIKLLDEVRHDLAETTSADRSRRIWLGAGSNTWRSELATDERYEKTTGPAGRPGSSLGIPWMAGIPGTIGGWVKMNAGAFGHSISEVIRRVKVDGVWLDRDACGFAYRHSSINGEIQDVEFDFSSLLSKDTETTNDAVTMMPNTAKTINAVIMAEPRDAVKMAEPRDAVKMAELCSAYLARRRKFPAGTKGSVFKNPSPDTPAGRLLEEAGAKSLRVGDAYVWQEHANVIVAGPNATPSDFLALARLMARAVLFHCGVRLEPEVQGLSIWP